MIFWVRFSICTIVKMKMKKMIDLSKERHLSSKFSSRYTLLLGETNERNTWSKSAMETLDSYFFSIPFLPGPFFFERNVSNSPIKDQTPLPAKIFLQVPHSPLSKPIFLTALLLIQLKRERKIVILDISILTCVTFYTFFLLNKLLIK